MGDFIFIINHCLCLGCDQIHSWKKRLRLCRYGRCFCFLVFYNHESVIFSIFLPASAIGLLSTAVLNLKNMRDIATDELAGKYTLPLRMGFELAKIYQSILVLLPFVLVNIYLVIIDKVQWYYFSYLILLIPSIVLLKTIFSIKEPRLLDKELKKVALLTLAFSLILGISLNF